MIVDIRGEVQAALAELGVTGDALEARIEAALARVLERREQDRIMSQADLARYLGLRPGTLAMRIARGSALASIAVTLDGRRVWRKSDVDLLLSAAKAAK